ncbi:hypothetical protein D917_02530 [Trichinella nativa]|uniref:Uncharacterized protein n=1 Tax=Trichinella nativa TaxID=6335 RepID=A0A1Y3E6K5_9BILA|nr:hypothetical protein D917_02530 [Trichinella nativa]
MKNNVFCTLAVYWALLVHVAAILILKSASLHLKLKHASVPVSRLIILISRRLFNFIYMT